MRLFGSLAFVISILPAPDFAKAQSSTIPPPTDYTVHPVVDSEEKMNGPSRIVSIAPSISEMCAALGLGDRVVGRTQYCKHPASIQRAAIVGGQTDTNYEKIISLKPDIVLITDGSEAKLGGRLRGLRLRVEALPDDTIDEVYVAIARLGDLLERPKTAQKLIDNLKIDLAHLSERAGNHRATRVLMCIHDLPVPPGPIHIGGPGGHMDHLLRKAGYSNALEGIVNKPWARISLETIIKSKPDVILEVRPTDKSIDPESLAQSWSVLSSVPAIRHKRIRSLHTTTVLVPGPRINIALHEMITVLAE